MSAERAYRLDAGEPLPEGIARIAHGRIDHALAELSGRTDSTPEEAVHEARKDLKKLRALLRMTRAELGDDTFRRENACFRDAGRELAAVRDDDAMLETLTSLDLPAAMERRLREKIQAGGLHGGDGRRTAAVGVVAILHAARKRVDDWPLERDSFDALRDGLERTYRRGRRAFRAARSDPTVEELHEWRKRVKELWYHHNLLRALWPPVMQAVGDEAHELANRLGEDHDLALLADRVREHTEAEPEFFEAVERRRSELQAEAMGLGERLYADRPVAYVRRLRRLWEASQASIRAP
ncbi:MAG TPA: CHAD domain-containing protein [Thermoleophilaceae bacterium]|nr:CHAD domain-containing protein [Thermoleophilaceae bacterium]